MMGCTPETLLNMEPIEREFAIGIATQKEAWKLEKIGEMLGG